MSSGVVPIFRWEKSGFSYDGSGWSLYLGNQLLYVDVGYEYQDSVMEQALSALARLISREAGWAGDDD